MEEKRDQSPIAVGGAQPPLSAAMESGRSGDPILDVQVYPKRWLILTIFVAFSASNSIQWTQFTIIEDVVVSHYSVSAAFVEWTSMVYMITYIIFIVPGSFALDKFGLRKCVLVGAFGTCLGAWIKVFGTKDFIIAFIGQSVVASSQVFILSVPARLAAVWFGPNEVSRACGVGVFGNQLGVALGFLLPPMIVKSNQSYEVTSSQLGLMFQIMAVGTSLIFLLIIFLWSEKPPIPPSHAAALKETVEQSSFAASLKALAINRGYVLLLFSYGVNVGVFYAISTLLNTIVLTFYPGASEDAGRIGLVIVAAGTVGSLLCGVVLDKTHKFKDTTLLFYGCSLLGMAVYTVTLDCGNIIIVYITSALLGFFMTGYLPVGFELAAELTYPEPEGTSVGLLNGFIHIFGILFTIIYSYLIQQYGVLSATWGLVGALGFGALMTIAIPKDYKRSQNQ